MRTTHSTPLFELLFSRVNLKKTGKKNRRENENSDDLCKINHFILSIALSWEGLCIGVYTQSMCCRIRNWHVTALLKTTRFERKSPPTVFEYRYEICRIDGNRMVRTSTALACVRYSPLVILFVMIIDYDLDVIIV